MNGYEMTFTTDERIENEWLLVSYMLGTKQYSHRELKQAFDNLVEIIINVIRDVIQKIASIISQ